MSAKKQRQKGSGGNATTTTPLTAITPTTTAKIAATTKPAVKNAAPAAPLIPHEIVFPGDTLHIKSGVLRLGNGILSNISTTNTLLCTRMGELQKLPYSNVDGNAIGTRISILTHMKRYIPAVDDLVVGHVTEAHAEYYRVDIGAAEDAMLPALAFEGASKRNKPNLGVGAIVYARISAAHTIMECELSCISPHISKEWVTGAAFFGELNSGMTIKCSLRLAALLLQSTHESANPQSEKRLLYLLGKHFPYEVAIGMNGRIWIRSTTNKNTLVIAEAIRHSENLPPAAIPSMIDNLIQTVEMND